jgi:hypothetical protein
VKLDELATGLDELARKIKTTRLWLWVGSALLESNGCLLRFSYTHPHSLQQQQQQEMEFVLSVIVMANLCAAASRVGMERFPPLRST